MSLDKKIENLHLLLQSYSRVAIAFSGGVDSSFLLKSALDALGAGNVLVLFARTCLVRPNEQQRAESWPTRHGYSGVDFQPVDLQPLTWKEFVSNPERRCYHCKLRVYKEFVDKMHGRGFQILMDGTNTDDLKERRPGLQAIRELGVKTPLVEAGFDKNDIRTVSRELQLDTWDQPSSSCLATRRMLLPLMKKVWRNWAFPASGFGCTHWKRIPLFSSYRRTISIGLPSRACVKRLPGFFRRRACVRYY